MRRPSRPYLVRRYRPYSRIRLTQYTATFLAIILAICALIIRSGTGTQLILTLVFPPMFYTFFTKAVCAWERDLMAPDILRQSPRQDAPILGLLIIAIVSCLALRSGYTLMKRRSISSCSL